MRTEEEQVKFEAEKFNEAKTNHKAIAYVVSEDGEHMAFFRTPNRSTVGFFMAEVQNNVTTACEYLYNDAVIREISEVEYFQKDENFYSIISTLQRLIQVKKNRSMISF